MNKATKTVLNKTESIHLSEQLNKRSFSLDLSANTKYWIKKFILLFLELALIVFIVYSLAFVLLWFIPSEPALLAEARQKGDPATIAELEALYGVNDSFWTQYWDSWAGIFSGTFGTSWTTGQDVSSMIWPAFALSIQIGLWSIFLSFIIGIPLGVWLGRRKNQFVEWSSAAIGVVAFGIPTFVLGLVAILVLSALGLPVIFVYGDLYIILVVAILIAIPLGFTYSRYLKNSVGEEYSKQYVEFAKIKGLSQSKVLRTHVLKPSLYPIATFIPTMIAIAILGSITLETIFGIPGAGSLFTDSSIEQDRTVLLAMIFVYTIFIVIGYFLRDMAYIAIDPNIRVKGGK